MNNLQQQLLLLVITNKAKKEEIASRILDITDTVVTKFFLCTSTWPAEASGNKNENIAITTFLFFCFWKNWGSMPILCKKWNIFLVKIEEQQIWYMYFKNLFVICRIDVNFAN